MTEVNRINRVGQTSQYGISSVSGGSGNAAGDAFREQMGNQLKEDYKKRFNRLFDDLTSLAENLLGKINISSFERYRFYLKELLQEATKNAYVLSSEYVTDANGRRRVFATIQIIDDKLDELAKDMLNENNDKINYLSRVDEIRGLIMDMLL